MPRSLLIEDWPKPKMKIEEMITEVNAELAFRHRCYPKLVSQGKMTQVEADKRIALMSAIRCLLVEMQ